MQKKDCKYGQSGSDCEYENYSSCRNDFCRLGYVSIPSQVLSKVYKPAQALKEGTIFPELNLTIDLYERGLYNGK